MPESGLTAASQNNLELLVSDVRSLLERQRVVEGLVARQVGPNTDLQQSITERRHVVEMQTRLSHQHPADIAYVLESLPMEERTRVWSSVWPVKGGPILLELTESVRKPLIEAMPMPDLVSVLAQVSPDDLPDLADAVPKPVLEEVYRSFDSQTQNWFVSSIAYPDNTVGQLMSRDMVTIRVERKLAEFLDELRSKSLPHNLQSIYVIDSHHMLVGVISIPQLLIADYQNTAHEVMSAEFANFTPNQDAAEAAKAFERYDLLAAPVIDERGRLIGHLKVDVVIDYLKQKADEEGLRLAGLRGAEDIFAPVWASARNRWLWLGLNLVTAFVASRVIGAFEKTISALLALATLMPIVASIGGNTGNQTVALIVRSLATGHLSRGNAVYLLGKEIRVALLNGAVWGGVMGIVTLILYGNPRLGLVMTASMILNLLVAAVVGVLVPVLLDTFHYDPAQGSSVLLTFTTDSMGFLIFLGLASLLF